MILILNKEKPLEPLQNWLSRLNIKFEEIKNTNLDILFLEDESQRLDLNFLKSFDCVDKVFETEEKYKLVAKKFVNDYSKISVGNIPIGKGHFAVIGGPCSIESKSQAVEIAREIKESGGDIYRGGAFKPRTSPYSFQGLEKEGLEIMSYVKRNLNIPIVSEVVDTRDLQLFEDVDMIQVGARNMQNFALLKELGKIQKPILLKRGFSNTLEELLLSAEYIMQGGNENIVLCERGIRTFEKYTRNTLDLSAIPILKEKTHLPIIVDPSHGTGNNNAILPMALAATVAGADGLMIEVHNNPEMALCDASQCITPLEFNTLMKKIKDISKFRYTY